MSARLPPGSVARWQVYDSAGRRGSSWTLRTSIGADDVYVTHREGGRWVHASFHTSGEWHFAVSATGQELDPGTPRYLGALHDHGGLVPGWLHALRITVARSQLRSGYLEAGKQRDLIGVPADPSFDAVSVDLFLRAPEAVPLVVERALQVADIDRATGGSAVVIARPMNLDAPIATAMVSQLAEVREGLRQHGWDGSAPTRAVIFGGDSDGYLREVEVAIDPER